MRSTSCVGSIVTSVSIDTTATFRCGIPEFLTPVFPLPPSSLQNGGEGDETGVGACTYVIIVL